jgi:hypothetical protein
MRRAQHRVGHRLSVPEVHDDLGTTVGAGIDTF